MQALTRIYERLGAPTARQLHAAAVRENLEVNKKQTADFVARQAEQQTFKAPPTSQGQTGAREKNSDAQADIIDMKTQKSGNFTAILIVINVWSKRVALEPLMRKTPQAVTAAFRKILQRMDKTAACSTDMANEFKAEFNAFFGAAKHRAQIQGPQTVEQFGRVRQSSDEHQEADVSTHVAAEQHAVAFDLEKDRRRLQRNCDQHARRRP